MVGSRTRTALVGLAASVVVSVAAWVFLDTLLVFLLVPFVPLLFRGLSGDEETDPTVRECPACGFTTRAPDAYCPRDGTELDEREAVGAGCWAVGGRFRSPLSRSGRTPSD